ncbi:13450_t:CDS:2 [Entrophospora sp. SA101]|nr:13450_t:CDS:2 [Entrophospora sp. SA101]
MVDKANIQLETVFHLKLNLHGGVKVWKLASATKKELLQI